jgi:hypothetical protein
MRRLRDSPALPALIEFYKDMRKVRAVDAERTKLQQGHLNAHVYYAKRKELHHER